MRSKAQGLLASLLMFIPLLAVPFVASFGVPWLAAKAKEEGLPFPDVDGPFLAKGVGQSDTGRHSAEDLFAPVVAQTAVDLRLAPQSSPTAAQNPHLRNASLVVSHNEAWVDPFESLKSTPSPNQPLPSAGPSGFSLEDPLEGWALNGSSQAFGPDEAPAPKESFESSPAIEDRQGTSNPFAQFETEANPPSKATGSQVAVLDNAFDDPIANSPVNRDPKAFDASRPLFNQNAPPEKSNNSQRPAEREPVFNPGNVAANSGNRIQEPAQPLTWETARVRLQELGIKDYYLQPNSTGQVFHFRCAYTPPDNPRIKRLFEEEAPEPLEAVRKVLVQVESWQQRQSASAN